ncbi:OX-2 membrane glycoprotein-like [Xiphias gladius]|uniref:OX-2 membrane glycoprotein-like n=1 Tax=Xiphias gladius TaxID=8245 RepID=UPI001A9800C8|nr:OX-2 membrane glycoprotein-like [Xiphias gladius]
MSNGAVVVIHLIFVLGVFPEGVTPLVQTEQTVVAAVGDDACLNCQLIQTRDVLQVTWQKDLSEGEKNLATHNKYFGHRVNPDFKGKVEIKDAGLQNSSIVLRNVTEQDEGCYLCLFNTYPDGALTGRTCLQLYELHEPILHVRQSDSTEGSVVSCSATGRPAPTVTLSVTRRDLDFSRYKAVSVNGTNGAVTVTATAVLSGFHDNSAQVGCAARVLSGQKEVFMMIPEVKPAPADGLDKESGSDHGDFKFILIMVLFIVSACGCVAPVVIIRLLQKRIGSLSQDATKTNQRHSRDQNAFNEAGERADVATDIYGEKSKNSSHKTIAFNSKKTILTNIGYLATHKSSQRCNGQTGTVGLHLTDCGGKTPGHCRRIENPVQHLFHMSRSNRLYTV